MGRGRGRGGPVGFGFGFGKGKGKGKGKGREEEREEGGERGGKQERPPLEFTQTAIFQTEKEALSLGELRMVLPEIFEDIQFMRSAEELTLLEFCQTHPEKARVYAQR